jgi:hypothetical protein
VKHVRNHHGTSQYQLIEQLNTILYNTLEENMKGYSYRDIATVAICLAKIMKQVESREHRAETGSLHRILHNLLVGINLEQKQFILDKVAKSSLLILSEFDARSLSNLIYSFALAEYVPTVEGGRTIMDILALEAMSKLQHFNSQDLSNMLLSYAKMKSTNSVLFKTAGDKIAGMNDLSEFWPQHFSNILWSYATAGESHPQLFGKFADHIVAMKDLSSFLPQALSNIIWAYATAGESYPQLYNKLANHIVRMKDLSGFKPQALSNILWSFATAGKSHPLLFQKLEHAVIARCNEFNSQGIANLLLACATVGLIDHHLFTSFAPAVKSVLGQCNNQDLANIAWSYAVANINDPSLFNSDFIDALQAKANDFVPENLSQLYQWQLWQDELKSGINLPSALCEKCRQTFVSQSCRSSRFPYDVISELSCIGLRPKDEVLTLSGYRLDALVEVNGIKVGIEVDGPYHFVNKEATGSTLLKRRQVSTLDDIRIVSVPYWEWGEFGNNGAKKQDYLRAKLGLHPL